MTSNTDDTFFDRADEHINLSNTQLDNFPHRGKVSASMMYSSTRFSAWVSACGFDSQAEMAASREETLNYFCQQYRLMLEENFDDYVDNFAKYMGKESAGDMPLS